MNTNNNKMTVVSFNRDRSTAISKGDTSFTDFLIGENGDFNVKDVDSTIATHLHNRVSNLQVNKFNPETLQTTAVKLSNVPSYDDVLKSVKEGQSFNLQSDEPGVMSVSYDGSTRGYSYTSSYGTVSEKGSYDVQEIERDKVCYLVTEKFPPQFENMDATVRFYHEPYKNQADAMQAFHDLKPHGDFNTNGSRKELLVLDIDSLDKNSDWYKDNMAVIDILKDHPELNTDANFKIHADAHLVDLNRTLGVNKHTSRAAAVESKFGSICAQQNSMDAQYE